MKSSRFDLEELNCWNKNLDIGLDASERNLDSFLHESCLGRIQLSSLKNHISLIEHCFWLKFGDFIGLWVMNPKQLSLHQLDFCRSRYASWNGWRSTLADCEIWLWRLRFLCSSLFYFLALYFRKGMDVSFLMPLESLHFNLYSSRSAQNIDWRSNLPIIPNLLLFASFIQKCLQNIKQRISRHFIYKT